MKSTKKNERERERERNNLFCMGKMFIECERQIYNKMMRIRRAKIKKDEGAK